MHIDQLQIELRPRTNSQALDLGFALLRSHAGAAYKAYLALWLPVIGVAAVLTVFWPHKAWLWAFGAWWLKPLLERAPLYVLSRQVFGTTVTWQEAVRAWPRQLGGGWLRLLTWGRPLAQTRCLHQSVWQLEMARGAVARTRRQVLSRQGTGSTAFWFCIVSFVLECVLQLGIIALIGLFMGNSKVANPFSLLAALAGDGDKLGYALLMLAIYGTANAIIAPIYTACGFTLYLNRRASLEAWDLELQLRQFKRPAAEHARRRSLPGAALLAAVLLAGTMGSAPDSMAAAAVPDPACKTPGDSGAPLTRTAAVTDEQQRVRREVDALYASPDVHGWICVKDWEWKRQEQKKQGERKIPDLPDLSALAAVMKVLIIAAAIGLAGWLMYRYRDRFPAFRRRPAPLRATEVGGLDIRAASLPDDVTGTVRTLWAKGERRAALALLYRATLSRLVTDDGLSLTQGNTEGDCLRLAGIAAQQARLAEGRLQVAAAATALWLDGAYAARWPGSDLLERRCAEWDAQFGPAGSAP